MTRLKKAELPTRYQSIHFRVSTELLEVIKQKASSAHLSISEYCRHKVTDQRITFHPPIIHNDQALVKELRKINHLGNNLNQIARYLNEGGKIQESLAVEVHELLRKLDECCNRFNEEMEKEYGHH